MECVDFTREFSVLYSALISSAYYRLLCIGEVAHSLHGVLAKNVHVRQNKAIILFVLESSKMHTKGDKPQLLNITQRSMGESKLKITSNIAHLNYLGSF